MERGKNANFRYSILHCPHHVVQHNSLCMIVTDASRPAISFGHASSLQVHSVVLGDEVGHSNRCTEPHEAWRSMLSGTLCYVATSGRISGRAAQSVQA